MFYLELFQKLEGAKIRYMLVGGLAMNLYGVPRSTMDVDIVLAMDQDNLRAFLEMAKQMNMKPVASVVTGDLLNPAARKSWVKDKNMIAFGLRPSDPSAPTVDVLIDPPLDIEAALKRATVQIVGGCQVLLASVQDLISLKERTGRTQDRADIEHLKRLIPKA
ncbi:MAG: hypothetical protein ACYC9J_02600 [Sulfuricaulis sp.]